LDSILDESIAKFFSPIVEHSTSKSQVEVSLTEEKSISTDLVLKEDRATSPGNSTVNSPRVTSILTPDTIATNEESISQGIFVSAQADRYSISFFDISNNNIILDFYKNIDGSLCVKTINILALYPGVEFLVTPLDFLALVCSVYTAQKFKNILFPQNPEVAKFLENGTVIEPTGDADLTEVNQLAEDTNDTESLVVIRDFLTIMDKIFAE
jgi:hypothetical protein